MVHWLLISGHAVKLVHAVTTINRDYVFHLFNWFQLFSSDKHILKVAGHDQNR